MKTKNKSKLMSHMILSGKAPSLPSLGSHFQIPDLFLAPKLPARRARTPLAVRPLTQMEIGGLDSDGREFRNADEMWREEVGDGDHQKKSQWYNKGINYWEGVEATVDGVLGGYGHVNEADIKASEEFLNTILPERFPDAGRGRHLVALDCGSGIGRVTKNLLIRYFNEVDLLEPVSHFLESARVNLAPENLMVSELHKAANFYCVPLQEFTPDAERYDVIWVQWCIGHLADDDFISFFKRAQAGLKPGGLFVLKENIAKTGFVLDKEDKSITRSDSYFKELFNQCGLYIYKMKDQKGFPDELFAVKMYALTTEMPRQEASCIRQKSEGLTL
ncbi:alpha N-terminal protein methyltransferase 1 isoform X3 [Nicotiana tabacum]|uniref:Alpha N-terminal protein methyltransferase 1 n=2 Tax=Nicotiana TaxID=4085 RepID=A0A1S4B9K5_TOBAC|nr:PREDICTED: alpha N-terminal protein methyltransferase 1 isoform X2 [Nicotiana sylvestris]XP_016485605.1 PREDICTED: alpha N-terminal protein methyltransferase 1-like isoform X3 [Nicotiana tabacum]